MSSQVSYKGNLTKIKSPVSRFRVGIRTTSLDSAQSILRGPEKKVGCHMVSDKNVQIWASNPAYSFAHNDKQSFYICFLLTAFLFYIQLLKSNENCWILSKLKCMYTESTSLLLSIIRSLFYSEFTKGLNQHESTNTRLIPAEQALLPSTNLSKTPVFFTNPDGYSFYFL